MKKNFQFLSKFLLLNNYNISQRELDLKLTSHPDYPSLYAITDTLTNFGISNSALRINKDQFSKLPNNFIALLSKGSRIVLAERFKKNIRVHFEDGKVSLIDNDKFLTQWEGVIVAVQPEIKKTLNLRFKLSVVIGILLIMTAFVIVAITSYLYLICTYLVLLIGVGISFLIIEESHGNRSQSVANICNASSRTSCDAVISSSGSKLFGFIELQDASFVYFLSLLVYFIGIIISKSSFSLFYLVGMSGSLILPYTIYYQWSVIKKWCVLCLGIALIVLIFCAIGLFYFNKINSLEIFNYTESILLLLSFFSVLFLWLATKKIYKENIRLKKLEFDYIKFKRNPLIFEAALKVTTPLSILKANKILLGDKNAKEKVILVINPSCSHCINLYKKGTELLSKNSNLAVELILNVNLDNSQNRKNIVAERLMEIYIENGLILNALSDWFEQEMVLDLWLTKWKLPINEEAKNIVQNHFEWCKTNGIDYTPAIIFKDYILNDTYDLEELEYFVD